MSTSHKREGCLTTTKMSVCLFLGWNCWETKKSGWKSLRASICLLFGEEKVTKVPERCRDPNLPTSRSELLGNSSEHERESLRASICLIFRGKKIVKEVKQYRILNLSSIRIELLEISKEHERESLSSSIYLSFGKEKEGINKRYQVCLFTFLGRTARKMSLRGSFWETLSTPQRRK